MESFVLSKFFGWCNENTASNITHICYSVHLLIWFFFTFLQLQEVSQRPFRQGQILPGPILRIRSSKSVNFLQPVAVQLPLSLSEPHRKDIDMSVVRVRILSSSEKREWIEITDKLATLPRFDGNVISFTVSQFSEYVRYLFDIQLVLDFVVVVQCFSWRYPS